MMKEKSDFIEQLYNYQKELQHKLTGVSGYDAAKMYGAATAAVVEICEMLQTDTRWKAVITGSKKEPVTLEDDFKEEFADALIYMMNVLVYADIDIDEIKYAVNRKLEINRRRFNED